MSACLKRAAVTPVGPPPRPEPRILLRRSDPGPNLGGFLRTAALVRDCGLGAVQGWLDLIRIQEGVRGD